MNPFKIRPFCERLFLLLKARKSEEILISEKVTHIIYELSQKSATFLKEFKRDLLDLFEADDFFNSSIMGLKTWSRILDALLDANKLDILSDHFEAFCNQSELFFSLPLKKH